VTLPNSRNPYTVGTTHTVVVSEENGTALAKGSFTISKYLPYILVLDSVAMHSESNLPIVSGTLTGVTPSSLTIGLVGIHGTPGAYTLGLTTLKNGHWSVKATEPIPDGEYGVSDIAEGIGTLNFTGSSTVTVTAP
jgi:hypothetical protein